MAQELEPNEDETQEDLSLKVSNDSMIGVSHVFS